MIQSDETYFIPYHNYIFFLISASAVIKFLYYSVLRKDTLGTQRTCFVPVVSNCDLIF